MFRGQIIAETEAQKIERLERELRETEIFLLAACIKHGGEFCIDDDLIDAAEGAEYQTNNQMEIYTLCIKHMQNYSHLVHPRKKETPYEDD